MDGLRTQRYNSDINLNLKWTSICVAVDLDADDLKVAINGDLNATTRKEDDRTLREKFTGDSSLPMTVRVGHYYFDNKPMIGKIMDFHMWNRYKKDSILNILNWKCFRVISDDELQSFSDCSLNLQKNGNLINPTTDVNVKILVNYI